MNAIVAILLVQSINQGYLQYCRDQHNYGPRSTACYQELKTCAAKAWLENKDTTAYAKALNLCYDKADNS